jgi:hypothetical protein
MNNSRVLAPGRPRRADIDWLRVLAVLLVVPHHAGSIFNVGEAVSRICATSIPGSGYWPASDSADDIFPTSPHVTECSVRSVRGIYSSLESATPCRRDEADWWAARRSSDHLVCSRQAADLAASDRGRIWVQPVVDAAAMR